MTFDEKIEVYRFSGLCLSYKWKAGTVIRTQSRSKIYNMQSRNDQGRF